MVTRSARGEAQPRTLTLLAIAGGALVLRLVYALGFAPAPHGLGDDVFYQGAAYQLADGHGYVTSGLQVFLSGGSLPTAAHPPLYPLLLAAVATVAGHETDALRLVGVLAGTTIVFLAGLVATRIAGPRAGVAAAALCAVYPAFVAADASLMSESLFGALVVAALLQTLRLVDRPSLAGTVGLGVLIGCATLARAEGLLLVVLLAVPVLAATTRGRRLTALGALVAATALALSPWVIRNWHTFGHPLLSTNEGTTLGGANCDATYYGADIAAFQITCLPHLPPRTDEAVASERGRRQGLRYVRAHQGRAAVVAGLRVLRLWGVYRPSDLRNMDGRDPGLERVAAIVFYPVLAAAVLGALVLLRLRRRWALAVVLVPLAVSTLTAVTTYGLLRLRHISEISLCILAGVALSALHRRRAAPRREHGRDGVVAA